MANVSTILAGGLVPKEMAAGTTTKLKDDPRQKKLPPLYQAALDGNMAEFSHLLLSSAPPREEIEAALGYARKGDHIEIVKLCVATLSGVDKNISTSTVGGQDATPKILVNEVVDRVKELFDLLESGKDAAKIIALIKSGLVDLKSTNSSKETFLHVAARAHGLEVLDALIEHGVSAGKIDVNAVDKQNKTALHNLFHFNQKESEETLRQREPEKTLEMFVHLVRAGAKFDIQDHNNETAVHAAVRYAINIDAHHGAGRGQEFLSKLFQSVHARDLTGLYIKDVNNPAVLKTISNNANENELPGVKKPSPSLTNQSATRVENNSQNQSPAP